jgi:hypothetical protein
MGKEKVYTENDKDLGDNVYKIYVSWECYGQMEVKANSLKEAIEKAELLNYPLPEGEYVDGSFIVDEYELQEEVNK